MMDAQLAMAPLQLQAAQKYGPEYDALSQQRIQAGLFGNGSQPGVLSILKKAMPQVQQLATADRTAAISDVQNLGPQAVAAYRSANANPDVEALLSELSRQSLGELQMGAELDPSLRREVSQSVRAGQAARGMGYGPNDVYLEAMTRGQAGEAMRQQRRSNAAATAGLGMQWSRQNQFDPFAAILGMPTSVNTQSALGMAGGMEGQTPSFDPFTAYGSDLYGSNASAEMDARLAKSNFWTALLGSMNVAGSQYPTGGSGNSGSGDSGIVQGVLSSCLG